MSTVERYLSDGQPDLAWFLGKRRKCTRCRRTRVVNAVWGERGPFLCRPCSHLPNAVYGYSLREARKGS